VTEWIGAAEAARRLGIKPASLYAYVSRGVLSRRPGANGRASMFDAAEVELLARRGRPRRPARPPELIIESAITEISGDELRFRGIDATVLARERSFEEVAGLLWTGSLADDAGPGGWQATPAAIRAGTEAQGALPSAALPLARLQVIVPALAATDALRLQLDRSAVMAAGRSMIAGMVDCLPLPARGSPQTAPGSGSITARLAARLCPEPLSRGLTEALRAAMVLLADHELAASTFAARVAASVQADPYAVVATGMGALGGALHGGGVLAGEVMLRSAVRSGHAPDVIGDLLRRGERVPGIGHVVYQDRDPRAVLLLNLLAERAPSSPRLAVATALLAEARRRALPVPNVDFALATLSTVCGLIPGAGEAVFAVARTAGWLAHALEEYERRAPIRPRSFYTGPPAPP
jgi:citrate synthase